MRTRVLTDFDTAVGKDDYFNIDLSASINSDGEYSVSRIQLVPPKKWEDLFIPSSFPNDYRKNISVFGRGAKDRTVKLVIFTRDILGHFGDDNMEVYAVLCLFTYYLVLQPTLVCCAYAVLCPLKI